MHSVYERVIINRMLNNMTLDQLTEELERAKERAEECYGGELVVNRAHCVNVSNHIIRRG